MVTFGKTKIGAIDWGYTVDEIWGSKFTLTEPGNVSSVSAYTYSGSGDRARVLIYDSSGNLKGESAVNAWSFGKNWSWEKYVFSPSISLAAGVYWLVWFADSDGGWNFLRYDAGSVGQGAYKAQAWNGAPNPITFDDVYNRECSIYATYMPPLVTHARIH